MKRILYLTVIALLLPINVFSQSLSAYGVSLGENKYKVESILKNKGKSVKHGNNSNGTTYLAISNPSIGGASFDRCVFEFNNYNKLFEINFSSSDATFAGYPGGPWEATFNRKVNECKNSFVTMAQNLKLKYGTPDTYSDTSIIWQKGKERISLVYKYKYEYNQYGFIDSEVRVDLRYETINLNGVDY